MSSRSRHASSTGQALPLFALSLITIILLLGLAIDAGYAYAQNRRSQNAGDFASMAGARIVGEYNVGNTANGTALRVYQAVTSELAAHNATLVRASYVTGTGAVIPGGDVATLGTSPDAGNYGTIPVGSVGIVVSARVSWRPFLLGVIGITNWDATTSGTAVTAGQSLGGGVLPVGLSSTAYGAIPPCPVTDLGTCAGQTVYQAGANPSGGFDWLKFGATGQCVGYGLGMDPSRGCGSNQPFLDSQIGPPADTFGCCTAIDPVNTTANRIGSLTGNKWGNLSYYIDNKIAVWVPIFDPNTSSPGGANGYYQILGFAPVIFTATGDGSSPHAKWMTAAPVSGVDCGPNNTPITGYSFTLCAAPGGAITLGATGGVRLVH